LRHPLVLRLGQALRRGGGIASHGIQDVVELFLGRADDVAVHIAYRHLALQLNHGQRRGNDTRSVLLISPEGGESFAESSRLLASNFAHVRRAPVLLVDLESRVESNDATEPSRNRLGLMQLLHQEDPSLDGVVERTSDPDVHFLPVGQALTRGDARIDEGRAMRRFLATAKTQYDFVIIHGGSLLHDSLPLALAPHAGRVLLCSRENRTRLADLDAARKSLELSRVKDIGYVMIRQRRSR
jgi:Mrp family chromosome partitioning ATPase